MAQKRCMLKLPIYFRSKASRLNFSHLTLTSGFVAENVNVVAVIVWYQIAGDQDPFHNNQQKLRFPEQA